MKKEKIEKYIEDLITCDYRGKSVKIMALYELLRGKPKRILYKKTIYYL